ncbi:MAG: LysR substrate-binding domain-containing protein [Pseudomonadota bacterium]
MRITLRQLAYFEALAHERHFGKAAARVAVTQPAMSAQIRELEANLGAPLVDRSGPSLTLTPLGRVVRDRAQVLLEHASAIEALGAPEGSAKIPIRLGMIPTLAPYLLPAFMAVGPEFNQDVVISEALTGALIASIRTGQLDAAVIALPSGQDDLTDRPLFQDRFVLAMPAKTVRPDWQVPVQPEKIDPNRLLLLDEGHCLSDQALSACNIRRETLAASLGATSLATISRLVAAGHGMTLIPEIAADLEGRDLRLIRFKKPEPGRSIGLVARQGAKSQDWFEKLAAQLIEARGIQGPSKPKALRRNSRTKKS